YCAAARTIWPWAKRVKLTYWMLRHRVRTPLTRTDEEVESALSYIATTAEEARSATAFPTKVSASCVHCDHRIQCDAFAEAVRGKRDFVCADLADLDAVAKEREEVAALGKILAARKKELETVLKVHLKAAPELSLAGTRYRMVNTTRSTSYPLERTLDA